MTMRCWPYIICPTCEYEIAAWKLGFSIDLWEVRVLHRLMQTCRCNLCGASLRGAAYEDYPHGGGPFVDHSQVDGVRNEWGILRIEGDPAPTTSAILDVVRNMQSALEYLRPETWDGDEHREAFDAMLGAASAAIEHLENAEELESTAVQSLRHALEYLLQQTVDDDLSHGIALTEGETDARDVAVAALATLDRPTAIAP